MNDRDHYIDFRKYEDELRKGYGENDDLSPGGVAELYQIDWSKYEKSFTITEQRWAELFGIIGHVQHAMRNGEPVGNMVFQQIEKEAREEGLFGTPVLMTYGDIRPINVNKFEKTRWNSIPEVFIDEEIVSGSEFFPTEQHIVTFKRVVRAVDGSIMLVIDGEGDKLELGVRIDELGLCEPIVAPEMIDNERMRAVNIDDDIRTLRIALEKSSDTIRGDHRAAVIESIMDNVVARLKVLKIGDQMQVEIPGVLRYENDIPFIDGDGCSRLTICGTFEGISLPKGQNYPIGIELSDISTVDKCGEEIFLKGADSSAVLPISKNLRARKIVYHSAEQE
jgi:hypothetical protein